MTKPIKVVQCGDWHLGWGFGGYDKIGKLFISTENGIEFIWRGNSQGRHGRTWNYGACATFKLEGGNLVLQKGGKGSFPVYRELISAANKLLVANGLPELPEDVKIV